MPAIWVTVQFVNEPKSNPAYGSIKTAEEGYISVPVGELGQFRVKGRYCIEVSTTPKGFKNFVRFAQQQPTAMQQQPAPVAVSAAEQGYPAPPAPPPQQGQQRPPAHVTPSFPVNADPMALNIFVTGIVGRALGSGHFLASDIADLTREAKAAFMAYLAATPPRRDDGMDQEIPFDGPRQ